MLPDLSLNPLLLPYLLLDCWTTGASCLVLWLSEIHLKHVLFKQPRNCNHLLLLGMGLLGTQEQAKQMWSLSILLDYLTLAKEDNLSVFPHL